MAKKPKKKEHRYAKQKYPGLNPKYQVPVRRELFDQDYINKLSDDEKAWLDKFNQETIITNFNHKGKKLITDSKKKNELYTENNKRNKDIFANSKAVNRLIYTGVGYNSMTDKTFSEEYITSESLINHSDSNSYEDYMLTMITLKELFNGDEDSEDGSDKS